MRVIDISQFENSLVIHFDTDDTRINAYTLASTLIAFADAAKAANTTLNAGSEIEIVVEALGPGSFRALVRALYSSSRNLFSNQSLVALVLGVLGNYIYERTLAVDDKVIVEIKTDEVIIQKGDDRVIVPRKVYEATRRVEKNPQFVRAVARTFEAVSADDKVNGMGLVATMDAAPPAIPISRATLFTLASQPLPQDPDTRVITEQAELLSVNPTATKFESIRGQT